MRFEDFNLCGASQLSSGQEIMRSPVKGWTDFESR